MKTISYIFLGVALSLSLAAQAKQETTPAQPITQPSPASTSVYTYQLDNGLTLWVKPDHRAPTVTHMVWYRVGSRDEVDGTSGVAHVLEHMMFKGTAKMPDGQFSKRVAELGGNDNAFTSYDMTAYFQQIPVTALEEMMALEADRMTKLLFKEEDFLKEVEVVKEERRMRTDENPRSQLWERLQAATYMADPYRRPIIGWMDDLNEMTLDDAKQFYQHWYRPDNAAVIIVGDIQPEAALKLAKQSYGKVPRPKEPLQLAKPRVEPAQNGVKEIQHKAVAAQSFVMMNFKTAGLSQWNLNSEQGQDALALTMLAEVLDGSSSARLERALVQGEGGQRMADSVGASYGFSARGPVTFSLYGVPTEGTTPEALKQALWVEVKKVANQGVSAKELERIKIQWVASQIYQKDSQMAQAQDLGSNWILNFPPQASEELIEALRQVTPEAVQSVAKRYFANDDELTIGTLLAQPSAEVAQ